MPSEGRRLLPEIPSNRSPRLVRQEHVREDSVNSEKRSPKQKTFAEAKQAMMDDYDLTNDSTTQLHFDEDEEASFYNNEENYDTYNIDRRLRSSMVPASTIKSAESFLNDSSPEYFCPEDYLKQGGVVGSGGSGGGITSSGSKKERLRRRKSRDLPVEPETVASSNEDEPVKRKPETMRSISEDSPGNKAVKPTPRRSLSHPEKDSQVSFVVLIKA